MNLNIFLEVFFKILPLYCIILTGFIAGKALKTDRDIIAKFLFFVITPLVIFSGIMKMENNSLLILLLPFIIYAISCLMCSIVYRITPLFIASNVRNIVAFSSGSSNTGHFGLPVALIVLEPETVAIYMLSFLGITLFENTYGFYVAAKGYFSAFDCIKKVFKLPALYAIALGAVLHAVDLSIPTIFNDFFSHMRSTYIVLGMSTIGLSLATIKDWLIDWKIVNIVLVVKYILWPMLMVAFIMLDKNYFHFYSHEVYLALLILSIVPISVSTVVVGAVLKYPSVQLSWLVLINTLVGLFYVPAMLSIIINIL